MEADAVDGGLVFAGGRGVDGHAHGAEVDRLAWEDFDETGRVHGVVGDGIVDDLAGGVDWSFAVSEEEFERCRVVVVVVFMADEDGVAGVEGREREGGGVEVALDLVFPDELAGEEGIDEHHGACVGDGEGTVADVQVVQRIAMGKWGERGFDLRIGFGHGEGFSEGGFS